MCWSIVSYEKGERPEGVDTAGALCIFQPLNNGFLAPGRGVQMSMISGGASQGTYMCAYQAPDPKTQPGVIWKATVTPVLVESASYQRVLEMPKSRGRIGL